MSQITPKRIREIIERHHPEKPHAELDGLISGPDLRWLIHMLGVRYPDMYVTHVRVTWDGGLEARVAGKWVTCPDLSAEIVPHEMDPVIARVKITW